MSRPKDPLDTLGDRVRSAAASWKAIIAVAICVAIALAWGVFSTTGTDELVIGKVARVEQVGIKQLKTRAIVDLGGVRQVVVSLPNQTNCRTGSTIQLIRRENAAGRSFRAALAACPN